MRTYRFGGFRLDPGAYQLSRGETPVPLAPKGLDLLLLFVSRGATLVTKDDILRELWQDVAVTDNALTQVVSDLRQALGDDPASPRFIQTVPRRGYRFISPVDVLPAPDSRTGEPVATATAPRVHAPARTGVRETSSIEAHRALTEGRLKLEAMDATQVPSAIADLERAVALDPRYAPAYVGLAHARFWLFEASRARNRPDANELRSAITHAYQAIELDPDLAEGHAALALMLTSAGRGTEAVAAGRTAVALEPGNWRHHCRLGVAAWGEERVNAFTRVLELYPDFAHAYYGVASVHVARGDLSPAEETLERGVPLQDRQTGPVGRFPGKGLHWLLGLIRLARGNVKAAHDEFDRELKSGGGEMYTAEYAMNACDGHGFAALAEGDLAGARAWFGRALELFPDHARSLLGRAETCRQMRLRQKKDAAVEHALRAIAELRANGRLAEAEMATAFWHIICERPADASAVLSQLLAGAPAGFAGWTIPVEPLFAPLRSTPAFQAVLARLAERAR